MSNETELARELRRCPTPAAQTALIIITALMAMTIIVANYTAVKLWDLFNFPVDGGLILFPLSYALGDILVEIYGRRTANLVSWSCAGIGFLTFLVMFIVRLLPDYPTADNLAFEIIADNTGRIFIASIVGFLASQLFNNYLFERIYRIQGAPSATNSNQGFYLRAFASSVFAHIPDILLFEPIAFLGRLSFQEFLSQAFFAYFTSIAVELFLLIMVTGSLAESLARRLKFCHGRRI